MAQPHIPESGVGAVPEETLSDALKTLDPVSRALLDLSLRRGIPDGDIAAAVGTDAGQIAGRRDKVISTVGASVGLSGPDELVRLREALKRMDWRVEARDGPAGSPPGEAERQGEPQRPKPRTEHARERSVWFFLGAAATSVVLSLRRGRSS
jgi:hypothetical protein